MDILAEGKGKGCKKRTLTSVTFMTQNTARGGKRRVLDVTNVVTHRIFNAK